MTLTEMLAAMQTELQITDDESVFTDATLTRGVVKAVALMSRLIPKRAIVETTITLDIDDETLTIASDTGTLTYKPVKPGSVTITGETLDTDYTINYLTGVVTEKDSGLADGSYTVSYEVDPYMLDISSLCSDYIKIERIQYPVSDEPATYIVAQDIFGDYLIFKEALEEDKHLRIHYLTYWTAPAASTDGDYPSSLDVAVIVGAIGESLIFKAEAYVQSAVTNIAASKTLLDAISAVTTPTAPTISSCLTDADTALDAAVARFAVAVTEADKMDSPLANAATALAKIATEIAAGVAYLGTGDDYITTINDAEAVAEKYATYGQTEIQAGLGYGREAEGDIALAQSWESRAGREMAIGNSYVNEAIQRLGIAAKELDKYELQVAKAAQDIGYYNAQVAKADRYLATAVQYLDTAGRYLASGQAKINEMLTMLGVRAEYNMYKGSMEQFS